MNPEKAESSFQEHVKALGLELDRMTPVQGVDAMLSFYRDKRAEGCSFEEDADMLLFQWGTYDWGEGEFFEFNITRQLIFGGFEDENIWQLSLTFKFSPDAEYQQVEAGNRWCVNLDEIDRFHKFIQESEAFKAVADKRPFAVELMYECAG